jgi:glycine amidinotransferase
MRYVTTESEPTFDAADFVRCGRDIFGQRSHVTNALGIDWLARHLGDQYRVHVVKTRCKQAMHIDTTLMPLAPGKVLVNPEFLDIERLPKIFRSWEVLVAPQPVSTATNPINTISGWANMNVLMLDEKRVIVEKSQEPMISALKKWGFTPLPCAFEAYYPFGGSFHCAILDIRRRGSLKSYF